MFESERDTSKFLGDVMPIPTAPEESILILSAVVVENAIVLAEGDVILALPEPELLKNGFVILLRAIVFSQRNCDIWSIYNINSCVGSW